MSGKEQNKEKQKGSKVPRKEKMWYLLKDITVEPMIAFYIIPSVLASLATQNLNLEKACRVNLRYSDEVCTALEARQTANYTHEEVQVQQLVAGMSVWTSLLKSLFPVVLIMFLGSWSDRRRRRKPCMLMPIVGEFLSSIGLILCTFFFYELPMEVAGVTEALFPAVTGAWTTMFMGIFSYLGDVTTVEMRTLRIGFAHILLHASVSIGGALSGILYKKIGYYGVFSLASSLYVVCFMYGSFFVEESRLISDQNPSSVSKNEDPRAIKKKLRFLVTSGIGRTVKFLKDFFEMKYLKETFTVSFKKGANNRRWRVMLLMVVVMVVIGPLHGE